MSEYVIKETVYADQDPESYFQEIAPPKWGAGSYVFFTFLDWAKKFKSKEEAEKFLKSKEFENLDCVVVELSSELKNVKKGFYLDGSKIKFHYVCKNYELNGRSEFSTEGVLKELLNEVESEAEKEIEELRNNFSWAKDLEDQVKRKREGVYKKYGI